jgi:P2-related tail formation protein
LSKQEERVEERKRITKAENRRYHPNKGTSNTLKELVNHLGIPVDTAEHSIDDKPD